MVNYLTLVICCISCLILGGLSAVTWAIFREKDLVEQIKDRLPKDQHNAVNPQKPFSLGGFMSLGEYMDSIAAGTVTQEVRKTSTAVPAGYKCPVENCRIQRKHSHTEDYIRRVK